MFGKQISALNASGQDVFSRDQWRVIQEMLGNCQQPLEHDGPVTLSPTFPATATQAALTVNSWQRGGGIGATGVALELNGTINYNGTVLAPVFPGAVMPFAGTAAQLVVWNDHGWYTADGTNGTVDLRDRFIVCKGSTYTSTGGAATHNHTGATGSDGTGTTSSSGTGATGSDGTGATGAAAGNTGSNTVGISATNAASGDTASGIAIVTSTDSGHTHAIAPNATAFGGAMPVGCPVVTGTGIAIITSTDSGHVHGLNSHTHTLTDGGHVHTLGSHTHTGPAHTHTGPAHTHTGPAHTHTISSDSIIPPYYALTFLMFVG